MEVWKHHQWCSLNMWCLRLFGGRGKEEISVLAHQDITYISQDIRILVFFAIQIFAPTIKVAFMQFRLYRYRFFGSTIKVAFIFLLFLLQTVDGGKRISRFYGINHPPLNLTFTNNFYNFIQIFSSHNSGTRAVGNN